VRTLLLASLATLALCAACGQKGPLVLPQKSVATPVLIRAPAADASTPTTPATPATPTTPTAAPAAGQPAAERKDDEPEPSPKH
jgi:predicted small lipoprotein YifL